MSDPLIQATPPAPEPARLRAAVLSAPPPRTFLSVLPFTIAFSAIHAVLCLAVAALLIFYIPRVERVLREFNIKLPASTEWVLGVGRWLANYWYILPPSFLLWLVLAGGLLGVLRQYNRGLGWLWALLLLLLPLLAGIFAFFAIWNPYVRLLEGLSR